MSRLKSPPIAWLTSIWLVLALPSASLADPSRAPTSIEADARVFAARFIDDYLAASNAPPGDGLAAVRARLTPELSQALEDDERAQQARPDDLVGLDWDPFFWAQDTPTAVTVGPVHCSHGRCAVTLNGTFDLETRALPLSHLLLRPSSRGFRVHDVRDPAGQGLLDALRHFQLERAHDAPPRR